MKLALTALLVRDYDEAIAFYCDALGFKLVEDNDMGDGKRWVVIAGDGGGRVGLFAHVDDFDAAKDRLLAVGAIFEELPRQEPYGIVAVFRDLYGNRWDLIEPKRTDAS
jgi:catechol 2,3-dioxygenase-like lactoylglutathione lyase family enzyme